MKKQVFPGIFFLLILFTCHLAAFNLSDHARKNLVRPVPLVKMWQADPCCPDKSAITDDTKASEKKAVLLKPGKPVLAFSTPELSRGTYVIYVTARSQQKPEKYRLPVYLEFSVSGKSIGHYGKKTQQSRMRVNYMSSSYQDVGHFYFDVNEKGVYDCTLKLGEGSYLNLLVDRIELRDVLGNTYKKGYKKESTVFTNPEYKIPSLQKTKRPKHEPFSKRELSQMARDIADSFPPRNCLIVSGGMPKEGWYQEFHLGKAQLAEPTAGRWAWGIKTSLDKPWVFSGPTVPKKVDEMDKLLEDVGEDGDMGDISKDSPSVSSAYQWSFGVPPKGQKNFNWGTANPGKPGKYGEQDHEQFKKTPSRWPDDGNGYFVPKKYSGKLKHNFYYNAMAGAFKARYANLRKTLCDLADQYYRTGNPRVGQKAALMLIFWADAFPSLDNTVQGTCNVTWGNRAMNTFNGKDYGVFGKLDYSGWAGSNNLPPLYAYDKLFPLIKDNQDLAAAVGQVIPWVKTPDDVIELLDVKLVQHYFDCMSRAIIRMGESIRCQPEVAVIQGKNEAGQKMFDKIVNHADFQYPALLDSLVCKLSRDGTSYIGSRFYSTGPAFDGAYSLASLKDLGDSGMLSNPIVNMINGMTLLRQVANLMIEVFAGGIHIDGVGDVSGNEGRYGFEAGDVVQKVQYRAWDQYRDPRYAWMMTHVYGIPSTLDAKTREEIRKDSLKVKRDPRFAQKSRALGGFGTVVLEGNTETDDFTKRNSLVMRTGYGGGHAHADQLNLEIFSHGVVTVPEFGGRPGYGKPPTTAAESHCLVTIDGQLGSTGWTSLVAHLPETPCAEGWWKGTRGKPDNMVRRFVSLIDAGGANAYVFDVNRCRGGKKRTYYFHGNEGEMVDTGGVAAASERTPDDLTKTGDDDLEGMLDDLEKNTKAEKAFVWNQSIFSHNLKPKSKTIDKNTYQAVWPMRKAMEERIINRIRHRYKFPDGKPPKLPNTQRTPKKFTRLILLNSKGRKNRTFKAVSDQVNYRIMCTEVSEERKPEEPSVFTAIIESFAGKNFVTNVRPLKVTSKSKQPVAVEVTVDKKRTDLLYQNDDISAPSQFKGTQAVAATGKFAFCSFDGQEPRACSLVNGTEVRSKNIGLQMKLPAYEAKIVSVDYNKRLIQLDRHFPVSFLNDSYFIVGIEPFHIGKATKGGKGTVLHFDKSALAFQAPLFTVHKNAAVAVVECDKILPNGWITNEAGDKAWPLAGIHIGVLRWMPTGHRGGPESGYKVDWDQFPDVDGDGIRSVTIQAHGKWKEGMKTSVLEIDPELRVFCFAALNSPEGYAGTRSYAGGRMVNERGKFLGLSVIPGKMSSFVAGEGKPMKKEDFTDANGDGVTRFKVYHFGPGTTVRLATYAGIDKMKGGSWRLTANHPVTVTVPGKGNLTVRNESGSWKKLSAKAGNGSISATFNEALFKDNELIFRAEK